MTRAHRIDAARLAAFDVHVHLEHTGDQTETDKHAAGLRLRGKHGQRPL